jgi:lipoyl(octanoyl) transferase
LDNLLDLGRCGYQEAWEIQRRIQAEVQTGERGDTLIFVEHPSVLTLGASFHEDNLRLPRGEYAAHGIDLIKTDRGGDVTFHGPDQLVIYPIFDLRRHGRDLHKWLRDLEETIIQVCRSFGLEGVRSSVNTGVWINDRKVAAIGIKVSRWVSIHGIALNCNNDLASFDLIVPCGITTHGVTSLSRELNKEVTVDDAKPRVAQAFENVFGITFSTPVSYARPT